MYRELPTNNDCWAIAKKVWPELKDDDHVLTRAKHTSMVSDIAWNDFEDYRLGPAEKNRIRELLQEWRERDDA